MTAIDAASTATSPPHRRSRDVGPGSWRGPAAPGPGRHRPAWCSSVCWCWSPCCAKLIAHLVGYDADRPRTATHGISAGRAAGAAERAALASAPTTSAATSSSGSSTAARISLAVGVGAALVAVLVGVVVGMMRRLPRGRPSTRSSPGSWTSCCPSRSCCSRSRWSPSPGPSELIEMRVIAFFSWAAVGRIVRGQTLCHPGEGVRRGGPLAGRRRRCGSCSSTCCPTSSRR